MNYNWIGFDQFQKELNEDVAEWQREHGLNKNFKPIKGFVKKKKKVERRHHAYIKIMKKGVKK
jgi:hypothetical protein